MGSEENARKRTALLVVLPLLAALIAGLVVWGVCGTRTAELEEERDAALGRVEELEEEVSTLVDLLAEDPGDEPGDDGAANDSDTGTEEPVDSAAGETPDGRYMGFIREIDTTGPAPVITIDFAEWLTGDEAAAAAAAVGEESPPPNDFYISNVNPRLRTFPVEAGITVEAVTEPPGVRPEGYSIGLAEWIEMYQAVPSAREVPYWIEVEDGTVTVIEEQYVP